MNRFLGKGNRFTLGVSRIQKTVTPKEYLVIAKNPEAIKSSKIIPPKMGSNDLAGKIVVEFNN